MKNLLNRKAANSLMSKLHEADVAKSSPQSNHSAVVFEENIKLTPSDGSVMESDKERKSHRGVTEATDELITNSFGFGNGRFLNSQNVGRSGLQPVDFAEVEELSAHDQLLPLRVFRSFSFSASLMFYGRELDFFAMLYFNDGLWNALKSSEFDAAEAAFRYFEDQATRSSEGDLRHARIKAKNDYLTRMINCTEKKIEQTNAHLQRFREQECAVSGRADMLRKEISLLESQRIAAQASLNKVNRRLHQLNLMNNDSVPHVLGRR